MHSRPSPVIHHQIVTVFVILGLLTGCTRSANSGQPTRFATLPPSVTHSVPPRPPNATLPLPTTSPTSSMPPPTASPTPPQPDTPGSPVIGPENAGLLVVFEDLAVTNARFINWLPIPAALPDLVLVTEQDLILLSQAPLAEAGRLQAPGTTTIAVSPDGRLLASASEDFNIQLWDLPTQAKLDALAGHTGDITGLAFSPAGDSLVSASYDNSLRVWDTATGELSAEWELEYWPASVEFAPAGDLLAAIDPQEFTVHLLEAATGEERRILVWAEHASPVLYGASFSPSWEQLAWIARGTILLMDVASGVPGLVLGHEEFVTNTAWSPDGRLLASAAPATIAGQFLPAVTLWEVTSGERVNVLALDQPVVSLAFSPDGRRLATLDNAGLLQLWGVAE